MHKYKRLLPICIMLIMFTAPANAWQVNEHYTNNTGQNAYDLTKFLFGTATFTEVMLNQPFPDFNQVNFGGFTIGHWYDDGGTAFVAPGDKGHACFSTSAEKPPPYIALWTDQNGQFIGRAGPVMDFDIMYIPAENKLIFYLDNQWHAWNGTAYPPVAGNAVGGLIGNVDIIDIKFAIDSTGTAFELEDLDSTLLSFYNFQTIDSLLGIITAAEKKQQIIPKMKLYGGYTVLFYFAMRGPSDELAYDVIAWPVEHTRVPATTNWGLAILLVLLISTAVYLYLRRRPKFSL